jgi:hypothetical protein
MYIMSLVNMLLCYLKILNRKYRVGEYIKHYDNFIYSKANV